MERQNANAQAIAEFLAAHPRVERVHYAGLPRHPGHDVAKKQMRGFGGGVSFEVRGDLDAASHRRARGGAGRRGQFFFLISQLKPSTGSLPTIASPIESLPAMRAIGRF